MTCDEYVKLIQALTASVVSLMGAVAVLLGHNRRLRRELNSRSGKLDISNVKRAGRGHLK